MKSLRVACLSLCLSLVAQAEAPKEAAVCHASSSNTPATQRLIQVGEEVLQFFDTPHPYTAPGQGAEGGLRHTMVLHSQGASYIAPHFSRLELDEGDYVVVRSPDGSRSWQYDNSHPGAAQGFWAVHIPGDKALVELRSNEPGRRSRKSAWGFSIDKFARGFGEDEGLFGAMALCGSDDSGWAKCYESDTAIYGHSYPVARLLINGTNACTGWLVGNQGHLMTNEHCIGSASDAQNTSYEFLAQGASCTTSCGSWFGCPGTVVASYATLVKADAPRDYALVQLPTNPTSTYGYLQLRSSGAVVDERIYIPQHPLGWGKKIAVASSHSSDTSGYAEVYSLSQPACLTGGPNDVGYYADTQGGSSGSPVIGYADNQVVALHHCANCPNRGVPIQTIISHLGSSLPTCALRSSSCPDPMVTPTGAPSDLEVHKPYYYRLKWSDPNPPYVSGTILVQRNGYWGSADAYYTVATISNIHATGYELGNITPGQFNRYRLVFQFSNGTTATSNIADDLDLKPPTDLQVFRPYYYNLKWTDPNSPVLYGTITVEKNGYRGSADAYYTIGTISDLHAIYAFIGPTVSSYDKFRIRLTDQFGRFVYSNVAMK